MKDKKLGYTFFLGGKSHYMKAAIEPFENEINHLFDEDRWHQEKEIVNCNPIFRTHGATADGGITTGLIIGIGIFVGEWGANKILDELYDIKIRPAIANFFGQTNRKINSKSSSTIEFRSMIFYKKHNLLVLVRINAESAEEVDNNFDLIIQTHGQARELIETKGKLANIHEYTIDGNKVNIEPNLFTSLRNMESKEKKKIVKEMKHYV